MRRLISKILLLLVVSFGLTCVVHAGTATGIYGLFFTGVDSSNDLLSGGDQDSHWTVTYARVNGVQYTTSSSTYTGSAYVVDSNYIDSGWVQNTSSAQWITAPGAKTSASGTTNVGGDYLPGNGTRGTNSAYYVYRLAFTITGTGTGTVTNQISISLTIAADDQYTVYVNPASSPTVSNTGTISAGGTTASGSGTSAWNNTTALTLQNYGTDANATFVIGTNYIYIVVANTNGTTGTSSSTSSNPSGLLVYQVGSALLIDGQPVPEVGAWLPVAGAVGLYFIRRIRRRRSAAPDSSPAQG